MDCPQQEKRSKRESESEIRENRYISPWSIMLRLLFALGPSAALHSTYTSLLISQTPAVCQLILTFSKSITPLSKVSVPANLYCAQTHTHTHSHTILHTHTPKKGKWERVCHLCFWASVSYRWWNTSFICHTSLSCVSLPCLSALTHLKLSTLDMPGHYPGLDWIIYRTYQLEFVLECFTEFSVVLW